jgi:hypothetical protein
MNLEWIPLTFIQNLPGLIINVSQIKWHMKYLQCKQQKMVML